MAAQQSAYPGTLCSRFQRCPRTDSAKILIFFIVSFVVPGHCLQPDAVILSHFLKAIAACFVSFSNGAPCILCFVVLLSLMYAGRTLL
jgi:hypothetical protein